jgi:hypothetical protein
MFGYIVANREELDNDELIRYRAGYCGLCRELGRRYGQVKRTTLTYDMVFFIVLLSSLYEPPEESGRERCIVHPMKQHAYWKNKFTDYAADMNIILTYYNCLDSWLDEKSIPGWGAAVFLKNSVKAIEKRYPRQCDAITSNLAAINELEAACSHDADAAANRFGILMAEICVYQEDNWSETLRRMASALGRFVYIMDAYEDIERDIKKHLYNPLFELRQAHDFEKQCHSILTMLIGECAQEFEKLPLLQDAGILRNILYSGVWTRYAMKQKKNAGKERTS